MARAPALEAARIGQLPIRPLRALTAFRKLARDKEDTVQVFRFIRALTGRSLLRQFRRLLRTAEGGRQAYLGEELAERLQDAGWLAGFGEGTVGSSYKRFVGLRALSAYGLANESRRLGEVDIDAAHPIAWYVRRQRDVHDIWHVLTGYDTDALGEACLLAFTFGQTRNPALGFLAAAAALELKRRRPSMPFLRAVGQAWRKGRRAAWLMALDYARLFAEPLADARTRLRIARPTAYEAVPAGARNGYRYPPETVASGAWAHESA